MYGQRSLYTGILAVVVATVAAAQSPLACHSGPGASLGLTGFTCASCGMQYDRNGSSLMTFRSEPVVVSVKPNGELRAGDVIVSVEGKPITTTDGAERFARPGANRRVDIRVRRDGKEVDVSTRVEDPCMLVLWRDFDFARDSTMRYWLPTADSTFRLRYRDTTFGFRGSFRFDSGLIHRVPRARGDSTTRAYWSFGFEYPRANPDMPFGFAVSCLPSCTQARAGANSYWKYDGYPSVLAIMKDGPAERAGLRMGDSVVAVDGISILEEKGAIALARIGERDEARITVLREGKKIELALKKAR